MKQYIYLICLFSTIFVKAQNTTNIMFDVNMISSSKMEDVPASVRKHLTKQMNESIFRYRLSFDAVNNYFQSTTENAASNKVEVVAEEGDDILSSSGFSMQVEPIKIIKNIKANSITEIKKKKKISKPLQKVKWNITKITKKILNYNCIKATTLFNGSLLTVYYTTEIKGIGSPYIYPFIKGVILEYSTKSRKGIATKVEFDQPDVVDFFK